MAFTKKWGTFAFQRIPFGLSNAGATFQRAMDHAFRELVNKSVLVYLDDIAIFSHDKKLHVQHLEQVFIKCKRYGISLNLKKSIFAIDEGKLLGHIISKEGWVVDPDSIKMINDLALPSNKKSLQSFLGQINFVKRFIQDFSSIIKHITRMLKKDAPFVWIEEGKEAFQKVKAVITKAHVLRNPDFSKEFILYAYGSDTSVATILT